MKPQITQTCPPQADFTDYLETAKKQKGSNDKGEKLRGACFLAESGYNIYEG
jgi:hypothetical protein